MSSGAVEEVKRRLDIVDVVGRYVALQKAGRNHRALCPFHNEKTPSFYVFPDRQTWHCFGACATGGDVISFVMRKDGLEFRDALRNLADRAGVRLGRERPPDEEAKLDRLRQANEAAAHLYHETLLAPEGEAALRYLEGRGLDRETIAAFQLGYSVDSWDALHRRLGPAGFGDDTLLAAGLLVEGDRGPYDRFRGRLMIPIQDDKGRVVGFGARSLDGSQPKYINTPQTPVFDKGSLLYGLHLAKERIREADRAVIVEGYLDVIAAHQNGLGNVVASMGTSLTERQVSALKRYSRNIVLALDADAAGSVATLRGIQVAASAVEREAVPVPDWRGLVRHQESLQADIRVVTLPSGSDPDDFIRSDKAGWERTVAEAHSVVDHLMDTISQRVGDKSTPAARAEAAMELLPALEVVPDPVKQAAYVQQLARKLRLDRSGEETVLLALRRRRGRPRQAEPRQPASEGPRDSREEFCLALLLRRPSLLADGLALGDETFSQAENREVFRAWREAVADPGRSPEAAGNGSNGEYVLESVRGRLPEELVGHLSRILDRDVPSYTAEEAQRALAYCVWGIEQRKLELRKQASGLALAESEERLGPAKLIEVVSEALQDGARGSGAEDALAEGVAQMIEDVEMGQRLHRHRQEFPRQNEAPEGVSATDSE